MLAEAAVELFLEQGFDGTNVTEIALRAGIGRSSFFNYASSKADLLWGDLDGRIRAAGAAVDSGLPLRDALAKVGEGIAPDALALAIGNAETMRIEDHLEREAGLRLWRLSGIAATALRREGADPLDARVLGGAYGSAVIAAIWAWASHAPGAKPLAAHVAEALDRVPSSER